MGIFSKLFRKETKQEEKIKEEVKGHEESYAQAQITNIPTCNGCGQDIEGTPRIRNHNGKIMYFHKRCWKAMCNGKLPKPKEMEGDDGSKN